MIPDDEFQLDAEEDTITEGIQSLFERYDIDRSGTFCATLT